MNDPFEITGADREFEGALRALSPASPALSPCDAAYKAGRRDAFDQQRSSLWIHRAATAAAIAVAALLGISALLDGPADRAQLASDAGAQSPQAQAHLPGRAVELSPFSYVALRSAVLRDGEIDLSHLPAAPAGGSVDAPADVRSIGDALREQRGM